MNKIKTVLSMIPMPDFKIAIQSELEEGDKTTISYEICDILNQSIIQFENNEVKHCISFIDVTKKIVWIDILEECSSFRIFNFKSYIEQIKLINISPLSYTDYILMLFCDAHIPPYYISTGLEMFDLMNKLGGSKSISIEQYDAFGTPKK